MKYKHPISESIAYVEDAVSHSNMLWLTVNNYILRTLKSKKSRKIMIQRLRNAVGPKEKGEPTSFSNIRSAANQLEENGVINCLI